MSNEAREYLAAAAIEEQEQAEVALLVVRTARSRTLLGVLAAAAVGGGVYLYFSKRRESEEQERSAALARAEVSRGRRTATDAAARKAQESARLGKLEEARDQALEAWSRSLELGKTTPELHRALLFAADPTDVLGRTRHLGEVNSVAALATNEPRNRLVVVELDGSAKTFIRQDEDWVPVFERQLSVASGAKVKAFVPDSGGVVGVLVNTELSAWDAQPRDVVVFDRTSPDESVAVQVLEFVNGGESLLAGAPGRACMFTLDDVGSLLAPWSIASGFGESLPSVVARSGGPPTLSFADGQAFKLDYASRTSQGLALSRDWCHAVPVGRVGEQQSVKYLRPDGEWLLTARNEAHLVSDLCVRVQTSS